MLTLPNPTGLGPNPIDDPLLPPIQVPEESVTPGVVGFLLTFLVAVAAILLIVDMSRRVRRVRYRGEVRERLEAERAERLIGGGEVGGHVDGDDATSHESEAASAGERRIDRDEEDARPVT